MGSDVVGVNEGNVVGFGLGFGVGLGVGPGVVGNADGSKVGEAVGAALGADVVMTQVLQATAHTATTLASLQKSCRSVLRM